MEQFWYAFIPLFVAFDGVGLLPVFWGLTHRLETARRRQAATEAVLTALLVASSFLVAGPLIFRLMGLELADVIVAGGVILIVLCLKELVLPEALPSGHYPSPGVVPVGVPLLSGPAVLTTVLLVCNQHGWFLTAVALVTNVTLVWLMLRASEPLMSRLGREGAEVISKIFNLILTAFGVMLIRQGLMRVLGTAGGVP